VCRLQENLCNLRNLRKRWEILAKLQETPKELTGLFRDVPDEVLRCKPAPEKWSMLEIACHLRDVEAFFVERYGKLASHDRPQLRTIKQDELAVKLRYNEDDPAGALREFQRLRGESVDLLSALSHRSWQRGGIHPTRGTVTIAWTAEHAVEHDANHLSQIRGLRERFVGPTPR